MAERFPDGCPGLVTGKRHVQCMHQDGCFFVGHSGSAGHTFRTKIKRVGGEDLVAAVDTLTNNLLDPAEIEERLNQAMDTILSGDSPLFKIQRS